MDAKQILRGIGDGVSTDFVRNRTLLSFDEYLGLFVQHPRQQARNSAQYLLDVIDNFGEETVPHPTGDIRRFKIFDLTDTETDGRIAGQEEVQNALYRSIANFGRAGRVNKLLLLHGPNGSAKSSMIDALKRGMERYSQLPEGALYRISWIFPSEKLVKGSIGFGDKPEKRGEASYAHLEAENIEVKLQCDLRDHPIFLVPREERRALLKRLLGEKEPFTLSAYLLDGELCHKCRRIYTALLNAHGGDYLEVLRHVQVERFFISRHYQLGTVTVEPQMHADAAYQQVTADRSITMGMPAPLQNAVLFQAHGALVSANRGLIEYSDLLKRPLEAYKYLLGFSETGEVPLEHMILQLDEVLIASANDKHLTAFKELPDFASFKGRIELIRVPYLRRYRLEREIYDQEITSEAVGKHVAPHATEVAAMWAVLTRLKKPIAERYPSELRELVDALRPIDKMYLYEEGRVPEGASTAQAKELRAHLEALWSESDAYPNYEGRTGASAREIKSALYNAAQNPHYRCLSALAVLEELTELCQDRSVYEFLQQEVVGGYHDHAAFVGAVESELVDLVDDEVRESMGLVSEGQYRELFERYIQNVSHWVKGEKLRNRVTGSLEPPDEQRMAEMEGIVMPEGEDPDDFRRGLISQIGAHRLDNPDSEALDYVEIFSELFRRLRDHFFEERNRVLQRNKENVLRYLSDEQEQMQPKDRERARSTLDEMARRYGYCDHCAKDTILFLMKKRYSA